MKTKNYIVVPVLFCLGLWIANCGNESTVTTVSGSGGDGTTTISGTVTVPSSATASISQGASAGKSAGGGGEESSFSVSKSASSVSDSSTAPAESVTVAKATAEVSAGSGPCQIRTDAGQLLTTCSVVNGVLQGCGINTRNLSSDRQITISCTVNNTTVSSVANCSNCGSGGELTTQTNGTTTTDTALTYYSCGTTSTVDAPSADCQARIAAGTFLPRDVYQTNSQLGSTGSAGADSAGNAMVALRQAMQSCLAGGTCTRPADMLNAIQGGGTLSSALRSAGLNVDSGALATMLQRTGTAIGNYYDAATASSVGSGAAARAALARSFDVYSASQMVALRDHPAVQRGVINNYASSCASGVAADCNRLQQGGGTLASFFEKIGASMTEGQRQAVIALMNNFSTFSGVNQSQLGEAMYSNVANCSGDCSSIRNNGATLAGTLFANPLAYTGNLGFLAGAQMSGAGGFIATGGVPGTACTSNSDCTAVGKVCGIAQRQCVASGGFGATCTQNSDCSTSTGYCSTSTSQCAPNPSGTGGVQVGQACTSNANCIGNELGTVTCSANKCTFSSGSALAVACSVNGDCTSGYCGGPTGTRVCKALLAGANNDICTAAGQCNTGGGYACSSGTCQPVIADGICATVGETVQASVADCGAGTYKFTTVTGTCKDGSNASIALNSTMAMAYTTSMSVQVRNSGTGQIFATAISGATCTGVMNPNNAGSVTCTSCGISGNTITFGSCGACSALVFTKQ